MAPDSGPEPTGWELLRAITTVNTRLDGFSQGFVSVELFNVQAREIRDLKIEVANDRKAREAAEAEARKTKAQQWFAIGSGLLMALVGVVGAVVTWSITASLQQLLAGAGG